MMYNANMYMMGIPPSANYTNAEIERHRTSLSSQAIAFKQKREETDTECRTKRLEKTLAKIRRKKRSGPLLAKEATLQKAAAEAAHQEATKEASDKATRTLQDYKRQARRKQMWNDDLILDLTGALREKQALEAPLEKTQIAPSLFYSIWTSPGLANLGTKQPRSGAKRGAAAPDTDNTHPKAASTRSDHKRA